MLYTTRSPSDFYTLLQIFPDASPNDIKLAYHRTLLRLHPDKQSRPRHHGVVVNATADPPPEEESVDVALLKDAYRTLSDVGLRAAYDGSGTANAAQEWWHRCRCGGTYRITQGDLENGTHLVGCDSCSEVIWVGYEEAPVTEDEEGQ
ncbi:hypothetical protein HD554DRAFT_2147454 [Boletus coccyginus]|nr:hypothetical protein HD554DRAFT_2147454 [Boletus coccyginus]